MSTSMIVLGKNGQLGRSLTRSIENDPGLELVSAYGHQEFDLSNPASVTEVFGSIAKKSPEWILNAAAYTAVDRCESEGEVCRAANGTGPGQLAELCARQGIALVHVSTDYVFAGDAERPYREDDATAPRTTYGSSKLLGEQRVLAAGGKSWVVRTSWVFGPGKNFVVAILRQAILRELGKAHGPLRVVDDQIGCPTYSADLAEGILSLIRSEANAGGARLLHLCNSEPCTWWDFARAILDESGYRDLEIERVKTSEFVTPAPRPGFSVLDCSRAESLGIQLRSYREALRAYLKSPDFDACRAETRAEARASS